MAKKSISPKKTASASDTPTPVRATKPRTRTSAPRKRTNKSVGTVSVESTEVSVVVIEPTDDEIRLRAYHRYLERGGEPGDEVDDWVEARKDLLTRRQLGHLES